MRYYLRRIFRSVISGFDMRSLKKQGNRLVGSHVGNLNAFAKIDRVLMPTSNEHSMFQIARIIVPDIEKSDSKIVVIVKDYKRRSVVIV